MIMRSGLLLGLAVGIAACAPKAADTAATGTQATPASPTAAAAPAPAPSPLAPVPAGPAPMTSSTAAATPTPAAGAVSLTPGASIEAAAPTSLGALLIGEIKTTQQNDWYKIDNTLTKRDLVVVRLQNKSSTLKPDFKIYNADRSQLTEKYDGTAGASAELTMSVEPGKTFFVQVLPYGSTGAYELSARAQSAFDAFEPNDDVLSATPTPFGKSVEANIMDEKDTDWFKITGGAAKSVNIVLDNMSSTLKPDIKIYSSTKSNIGEKYDGTPGANLDFKIDVEPGKDFYVQVLPYGSTGKYKLSAK